MADKTIDTPELARIHVRAICVHRWDSGDAGEVVV